jgi:predicted RNA binding protein YcfA (HicA-like mRNA interferase family)
MTKLPVTDARTMEKVLVNLGFAAVRQKGSQFSIAMSTDALRPFRTTLVATSPDR